MHPAHKPSNFGKRLDALIYLLTLVIRLSFEASDELFVSFYTLAAGLLRAKYLDSQQNKDRTFQSVILAGVYDIKNLKLKLHPQEESKYNSSWNTWTITIPIPDTCSVLTSINTKKPAFVKSPCRAGIFLKSSSDFYKNQNQPQMCGSPHFQPAYRLPLKPDLRKSARKGIIQRLLRLLLHLMHIFGHILFRNASPAFLFALFKRRQFFPVTAGADKFLVLPVPDQLHLFMALRAAGVGVSGQCLAVAALPVLAHQHPSVFVADL